MTKKKLKLKKQVWFILIGIILIIIISIVGKNKYEDYKYKQTNEYKLLEIGYKKNEIKLLNKNLTNKYINKLLDKPKNDFLLTILEEKYYLKNNLDSYLAFHEKNKDIKPEKVIALVNTFNNYEYYEHDIKTDTSLDTSMLVNKYYYLDKDYAPNDLEDVANTYYYGENHKTREVTYNAFQKLWKDAHEEGIYFIINSSFRTFIEQEATYQEFKDAYGTVYADEIAARPGYSEHQTGLALDIFTTDNTSTDTFKNSEGHKWLQNNAYKYGFIERYPENKEDITGFGEEAWHWRYVGEEIASYIHDNNITFDEYYAYYIANNN